MQHRRSVDTCDDVRTNQMKGTKSQSLSSYKLHYIHKAKENSASKKVNYPLYKAREANPKKKLSKSKFLSVNGWNDEFKHGNILENQFIEEAARAEMREREIKKEGGTASTNDNEKGLGTKRRDRIERQECLVCKISTLLYIKLVESKVIIFFYKVLC